MQKRERAKGPWSIGDGLTGRRTGVTVEDTGERDEYGFEPVDNYYKQSEDDDSDEEEKPGNRSHAMSSFRVQRDDSDDEQASHVNLPPQTPARPPQTKTQAVRLNDVTQRATNQQPKQTSKQPAKAAVTTPQAPSSARRLKIVSAVPVSKVVSKPTAGSSKGSSFDLKPASQTSSTAPKITKVSSIKSIQPVSVRQPSASQPKNTQPSPNDTIDSIDMSPAPFNNPYVAPPSKFVPKTFTSSKPSTAADSIFKTPARGNSLYGDSPADSTPGVPTPAFKPAEFKPGTFQFGGAKDVFDIPEDEPLDMGMDVDMDMDMSMDTGLQDDHVGFYSPKNEVKGVRPADVFNSPNVPNSRDSRGSLFDSPDVPKPLPKSKPMPKAKETKKPAKERKPSFAEKYKPRDFSKDNSDIFKSFKVPSKTVPTTTFSSKPAVRVEDDDNDSDAMDFTSIAKSIGSGSFGKVKSNKSTESKDSKSGKSNTSNDSVDFDFNDDDIGGGDYDISMGGDYDLGIGGDNDSLGSLDEGDSAESNPARLDRSINYREISTVDDSRMHYEEDSDDDYEDQSYKVEDDGDEDEDDEYNSAVDETMTHGKDALPSPPRSRRRQRPKRNVGRPVRYWMGEGIQYKLEKSDTGGFVPVVQSVTRLPDEEDETGTLKRKKRKAYDVDDAVAEAEGDAQENADDDSGVNVAWAKKKSVDVEVVNYLAEEGDPEMHTEKVAYTHDGCEYTDPSPDGLSVSQLFGHKNDFTQSGMVRLLGGGHKPERNSRHHLHHFYVLSGCVDVTIGENVLRVKAGCPFLIPRGCWFGLKNSSESIEALLFYVRSHDTLLRYDEKTAQAAEELEQAEEAESASA
ncbi:hypothetical protein CJU90_1458 [Yarrowia sp. C11]|nr:hypothetical protein CKK34_0182 [Yarrowia sp. E02]KAG5371428.1 hypothetical protein CJU90_1458 [Yarrowia sp. C11]